MIPAQENGSDILHAAASQHSMDRGIVQWKKLNPGKRF